MSSTITKRFTFYRSSKALCVYLFQIRKLFEPLDLEVCAIPGSLNLRSNDLGLLFEDLFFEVLWVLYRPSFDHALSGWSFHNLIYFRLLWDRFLSIALTITRRADNNIMGFITWFLKGVYQVKFIVLSIRQAHRLGMKECVHILDVNFFQSQAEYQLPVILSLTGRKRRKVTIYKYTEVVRPHLIWASSPAGILCLNLILISLAITTHLVLWDWNLKPL